jgi:type VI secretion system secreted protein VgrG
MKNISEETRRTLGERIVSKLNLKLLSLCIVVAAFSVLLYTPLVSAQPILGSAEDFAVLAGTPSITNTGATTIIGDVGISPAASITGTETITLTGAYYLADSIALAAKNDLSKAYTALNNMPVLLGNTLGSQLGGLTLTSGVYNFSGNPAAVLLNGILTLNAQGNNNAYWVFQIPFGLTAGSTLPSSVVVSNIGSNGGVDDGVFFVVGSLANLYGDTSFEGNILAGASITLEGGATIMNGRALAQTGDVTMINNIIENVCPNGGPGYSGGLEYDTHGNIVAIGPSSGTTSVPEPTTMLLLGLGLMGLAGVRRKLKN